MALFVYFPTFDNCNEVQLSKIRYLNLTSKHNPLITKTG